MIDLVFLASPVAQMVKNLPAMQETRVQSLGWEDPLEEGMASPSSILAWRIPRTEETGGLQWSTLRELHFQLLPFHANFGFSIFVYTISSVRNVLSFVLSHCHITPRRRPLPQRPSLKSSLSSHARHLCLHKAFWVSFLLHCRVRSSLPARITPVYASQNTRCFTPSS